MEIIKSTSNAKVKRLVQLKKKRKLRDEEQIFIVEGIRMARELPKEQIKELYVSESFYKEKKSSVLEIGEAINKKAIILSDTVFEYVSDTKTPQGIMAIVKQAKLGDGSLKGFLAEIEHKCKKHQIAPSYVVLDNLQDPGNLGTIFRSAEAAGVSAIIMSKDCVDIYNPKTVRSTMGAIFRVPFIYVENLVAAIEKLKGKGVSVFAAHLKGKLSYDKEDYTKPVAFLIGNEGNGLSDAVADTADHYILIPMMGQVESLNAAIAMTVLSFEMARQRRE